MFLWLGDRLWIKNRLASEVGVPPQRILFTEHHRSHAASAFYPSPFEEAAILTVDGVGEWATTSFSAGRGSSIRALGEIHFPHSIGLFYSALTAYLGFEVNEGEQKVMAMAALGEPRFEREIGALLNWSPDASFHGRPRAVPLPLRSGAKFRRGPGKNPGALPRSSVGSAPSRDISMSPPVSRAWSNRLCCG